MRSLILLSTAKRTMFRTLSLDDLYIARKLLHLEIYRRNGQDFEYLFSKIMRLHNIEFVQIKPQGVFGDRKNDGFVKSTGTYYQVYAPENAAAKEKETIDKLVTDFTGLYSFWNTEVTPIKEFNFVLNDKFQGAYASLHSELAKIEAKYQNVKCAPFLSQNLEDIFLKLPHAHIIDILGNIPTAEEISLNVSILNEVIEHLITLKDKYGQESIPVNPDFEEKINFNSLSLQVATFLRYGSYQDGALKEYFKLNSTFTKDELKNTFNGLYLKGMNIIPDSLEKNDLVFFYIANNAYPVNEKVYTDAVFVLMAYFFSYCDIFEEPPTTRQNTLFGDIAI
jgi:hypothetical protein